MTAPPVGRFWPGTRTLLTAAAQEHLDLDEAVGQRQATFRFALTDGVTGENLGDLNPIRTPAILSHDTSSTTKRRLTIGLGKADLAAINQLRDRVSPFMVFPSVGEYPLGRYMFTLPQAELVATQQRTGTLDLNDEMFLVNQQLTAGINGLGETISNLLADILTPLPIDFALEPSPYVSAQSWGIGNWRGSIIETLALTGDYWSPWFDNNGTLQFLRTFDPTDRIPDIDLDTGARVIRNTPVEGTDLLTAPNVFIVISNGGADQDEIVGRASVPPTAPHSAANRGFDIPLQINIQLSDQAQASAVAASLVQRQVIFDTISLSTPPDPRHDGYNVIRFDGKNWLEVAWSMEMIDGGEMTHTLRRSHGTT